MQRILIGVGVVVAAIILAIVLMPGVDKGPASDAGRKQVAPVQVAAGKQGGPVVGRKATDGSKGSNAEKLGLSSAISAQKLGQAKGRSARYQKWLASNGLVYKDHIQPLKQLDAVLAGYDDKESMLMRKQVAELEKLTQQYFEDPDAYKLTYKTQQKFMESARGSSLSKDPDVLAALNAYQANTERAHDIIKKL